MLVLQALLLVWTTAHCTHGSSIKKNLSGRSERSYSLSVPATHTQTRFKQPLKPVYHATPITPFESLRIHAVKSRPVVATAKPVPPDPQPELVESQEMLQRIKSILKDRGSLSIRAKSLYGDVSQSRYGDRRKTAYVSPVSLTPASVTTLQVSQTPVHFAPDPGTEPHPPVQFASDPDPGSQPPVHFAPDPGTESQSSVHFAPDPDRRSQPSVHFAPDPGTESQPPVHFAADPGTESQVPVHFAPDPDPRSQLPVQFAPDSALGSKPTVHLSSDVIPGHPSPVHFTRDPGPVAMKPIVVVAGPVFGPSKPHKVPYDPGVHNDWPAKYHFSYKVHDYSGNDFGHTESREGYVTKGHYHVALPDGRLQHVHYWADKTGYHAKVTYDTLSRHPVPLYNH